MEITMRQRLPVGLSTRIDDQSGKRRDDLWVGGEGRNPMPVDSGR